MIIWSATMANRPGCAIQTAETRFSSLSTERRLAGPAEPASSSYEAATRSAQLRVASWDGASTMAMSSGGAQTSVEDGAEATKDRGHERQHCSHRRQGSGHAGVTTGTVSTTNVG